MWALQIEQKKERERIDDNIRIAGMKQTEMAIERKTKEKSEKKMTYERNARNPRTQKAKWTFYESNIKHNDT